jgi:hypothetical protein
LAAVWPVPAEAVGVVENLIDAIVDDLLTIVGALLELIAELADALLDLRDLLLATLALDVELFSEHFAKLGAELVAVAGVFGVTESARDVIGLAGKFALFVVQFLYFGIGVVRAGPMDVGATAASDDSAGGWRSRDIDTATAAAGWWLNRLGLCGYLVARGRLNRRGNSLSEVLTVNEGGAEEAGDEYECDAWNVAGHEKTPGLVC